MKKQQQGKRLLDKFKEGTLTDLERAELESWYNDYAKTAKPFDDIKSYQNDMDELSSAFPFDQVEQPRTYKLWPYIASTAVVIVLMAIGWLYFNGTREVKYSEQMLANDIKPGGNKAYLTLADGSRIVLTDSQNGELAKQSGITITKTADGQILYTVSNKNRNNGHEEYNTIETPKGGQYQVQLPDGTSVWLNAASSLKYPVSFERLKERKVILKGEAYFEVAKNKSHPFIVKTDKQEVEVLGTHFNINSYSNDLLTKTTLLEGSVKVSGNDESKILYPGQQACLSATGNMNVIQVDTELTVAWKNNLFMFESETIENIMKMVERWYDVEVVYEGELTDDRFGGSVSRFENVSKVLKILESTKSVHFKIEGRRITVMK